jgi:spermidine/putrescine transport system substrate-binding protein
MNRAPQFQDIACPGSLIDARASCRISTIDPAVACSAASKEQLGPGTASLYHVPHVLGLGGDLLAHRPVEDRARAQTLLRLAVGWTRTRARCRAARTRCLLGIGLWMGRQRASCRPTACATATRTSTRLQEAVGSCSSRRRSPSRTRPSIKQFWDSADNTKSGLMENGVVDRPHLGRPADLADQGRQAGQLPRRRRKAPLRGSTVCR